MPSLPRSSRSRSASNRSRRASYRDAAQQTSESRSSSRRRSVSPHNRRTHRTPMPSPTRPSARHPSRKRFGLNVPTNQARIGKFDFEDIYPEDPIYEELGPNARAWRVNLDECEVFDNDMVTEARDGLDLLLVFAGLFSAVLTTFVAQTSQALSNNFPAVSTSLLLEMVSLQRAFINGTPIDEISSSEMTSGPSGFDVWVNALWFTSLTLSLGTALMAVLVKQWLYQYMSIISGTARDRSLIRFYRFDGLRKWHVLTIIGTLPIVLHVALGLFLAGLVVFLIPLNIPLASVVSFITVVIYAMYAVSNILPIIHTQCPYRTPFSDILNVLMRPIFAWLSFTSSLAPARALCTLLTSAAASAAHLYRLSYAKIPDLHRASPSGPSTSSKVAFQTLKDAERIAATGDEAAEGIAADALVWLHQMTSNPPTKSIVLQSLGCFSDDVSDRLAIVNTDLEKAIEEVVYEPYFWSIRPGCRAERLLRAQRHNKEPPQEARPYLKVDVETFQPRFHIIVAAILTSTSVVTSRRGKLRNWSPYDLLMHIIQEYSAGHPILLPSALWQQFTPVIHRTLEDINPKLPLCRLALDSWDNTEWTPPPFSGGVPITHDTVPLNLKHVITSVLPHNDLPDSEPLRQLCIINDYIVSELSTNRTLFADDTISILLNIWARISGRDYSTSGHSEAVCRRAERCILEVFVGDWWDRSSDTDVFIQCYNSVIEKYGQNCGRNRGHSLKLFAKLLSELCLSSVMADTFGNAISGMVEHAFSLDVESTAAYYTLLCGSESPFFSPRTKFSIHVPRVIATFVSRLARGPHPPALTRQCMEFLYAEPDRLFTVCRILALETDRWTPFEPDDEDNRREGVKENLLKLARLNTSRAAWQDRTHCLIDIDPWDWKYFSIPHDYQHLTLVQERMRFALKVLDDFFASPSENPPNPPQAPTPSEPQTGPVVSMGSQPESPTAVSHWRRARQLVPSARASRHSSSSPVDIELAGRSNDRPSQMSASESRHMLATIEPANAAAGPSSLPAPAGDDSMV